MGNKTLEVMRPMGARRSFRYAVFDFDGTLSLIREGWQGIMIPYFASELAAAPGAAGRTYEDIYEEAKEFIVVNTGKQTIYQCIELARRISALGGIAKDPQEYKDEYVRRLLRAVDGRRTGLASGACTPEDWLVPGSQQLLAMLRRHGVTLYLASGTDDEHVKEEAALLGLTEYFGPHIYGAQRDYKTFSKKMVIERILRENSLPGEALLGFGDGYVEIEDVKAAGGFACGVASNEKTRQGVDEWKRQRLIRAGADIIIPDYRRLDELEAFLFEKEAQ